MDLEDIIDQLGSELQTKMSEFQENDSRWLLKEIELFMLHKTDFNNLSLIMFFIW